MGWKELFSDHGMSGYERTKLDNNSSTWKSKYSKGWSSTSSWASKIPGFSGFSYSENGKNKIDALVAALPVLCNSIGLFEPSMKIQWADANKDNNNFITGRDVVLLSPDLILKNIKDSSKISQAYDALIGDAIMAGYFTSRVKSMANANEYRNFISSISVNSDSQIEECEYIFSCKSLKANIKFTWSRRNKKTRNSITFNNPFKIKFGRLMKFTLPNNLNQSAIQLALACEQKLAEKNICDKYKGANSYIFASRQISSNTETRDFLRKNIAKVRPFLEEEKASMKNVGRSSMSIVANGFTEMIASIIIWNVINPDDKIYGTKYSSAIIKMVEKNLLPSVNDLPDVVLAKCIYIVNFIKQVIDQNPESYEEEGQEQGQGEGQGEEGQDQGEGQGEEGQDQGQDEEGQDQGEGEGQGEEGQDQGQGKGQGKEGQDQGEGEGQGEEGQDQGEGEGQGEGKGEGKVQGQGQGQGEGEGEEKGEEDYVDVESSSSYSHESFDDSKAWNGNVRNAKMPLQLKDALEDIKRNSHLLDLAENGSSIYSGLEKHKNGILSSSFRIKISEINSEVSSEQTPAFNKPLSVSDTRQIRLLQFTKADSNHVVKIIDHSNIDSKTAYATVESNYRRFIDSIRERLKVRSIGHKAEEHCKSSGILDEGNIWQLYDNNYDQIFYNESQPKVIEKAHISILVDASGSMSDNRRIDMVRDMGVILSSALSDIWGVEFRLYGHSFNHIYDFNNGSYNSTKDIMLLSPDGGTEEGNAMQFVLRDSYKHKIANYDCNGDRINHYLIVIGDGQSSVESIQSAVKIADEIGIKFCHIGVDNAYNEEYGKKCYGAGKFAILPKESVIQSMVTTITKILS